MSALKFSLSLLGLALVSACSTNPPKRTSEPTSLPQPAPQVEQPTQRVKTGLVNLPTPQAVIDSVNFGRNDPFSTPAVEVASGPGGSGAQRQAQAPLASINPEDEKSEFYQFSISGIVNSNRKSMAFVQLGPESGYVQVGDVGGITTDLVPKDWRVRKIDISSGTIVLAKGKNTVTAEF